MLSIVIVNWNTGRRLAECLASIARLPEKNEIKQIFVIDNHSSDDSVQLARESAKGLVVQFKILETNVGFAAANNVALREMAEEDGHVLLLNPDTEVKPGALTTLLSELNTYARAGIIGPQLLNPDGSVQSSVRAFPGFFVFVWLFLKLHYVLPFVGFWKRYLQTNFNYAQSQAVDQVMGAAFLIRDEVLKKVGLLDERFWIWFEEVDYCKRVKDAGWEVRYVSPALIIHYGAVSFNQLVGLKRSLPFIKSSLHYAKKHLGLLAYVVLFAFGAGALLLALPSSLAHLVLRSKNKARL